jgi:hypothetical protein
MTDLENLIGTLTSKEIRVIRSYIGALGSRGAQQTEYLKMFNYILKLQKKKKILSEKELQQTKVLRSRLKPKILDALTAEVNINRPSEFEEVDYQTFRCLNTLLQIHYIYRTKGGIPIVFDLLDQVERVAKRFELYHLLIECLRLKKYMESFRKGLTVMDALNKEIAYYSKRAEEAQRSNDLYFEYILGYDFKKSISKSERIIFLKKSIAELYNYYLVSKSKAMLYFLLTLRFALFEELQEYEKAKEISKELLKLVTKHPQVKRKHRVGVQFTHRSVLECNLGNVKNALKFMKKAEKYTEKGSSNWLLYNDYLCRYSIFLNNLDEAERFVAESFEHCSSEKNGNFRIDLMKYNLGYIHFIRKDYSKTLAILRNKLSITKDPMFDFYCKLMTLMCLLESNDEDSSFHFAQDLKAFIYKKKKEKLIHLRQEAIGKLIIAYVEHFFTEKKLPINYPEITELLKSSKENYKWDKFGPELIPFHEWILSKTEKIKTQRLSYS